MFVTGTFVVGHVEAHSASARAAEAARHKLMLTLKFDPVLMLTPHFITKYFSHAPSLGDGSAFAQPREHSPDEPDVLDGPYNACAGVRRPSADGGIARKWKRISHSC